MGKVVLTYEQPGDIHSGKNKVIRAGGGGGTSDYEALSNKPSINSVELVGNKTSSDLGIIDVDQGIENAGKVLTVNSEGNVEPAEIPQPTIEVDASEVTYDGTVLTLEGDDVEEVLDSVDERFTQIGRLKYHLPEWTKTIKYVTVDTIDPMNSGAYFGEYMGFAEDYPPTNGTPYTTYLPNVQQYYNLEYTYKQGPFYNTYTNKPVKLGWTFNEGIDIEKTPYLIICTNSSNIDWGDKKPTRLRIRFSSDNLYWNEFTIDVSICPTVYYNLTGKTYTNTYFYIYIDVREFVGTDSTLEIKNGCKEISYQDYLALSDAEKMNGTAYYINDLEIEGEEHRISTTEQMVDVFVDGKPVYEKLIQFDETIDLDVRNSSVILENAGFIENLVDAIGIGDNNGSVCAPEIFLNGTDLVAANPYPFGAKYVILRYTKVTDEPLPEGVGRSDGGLADPIHVYNTEERFVGKWIDGKNIYEKTIEVTGYTSFSRIAYDLTTIPDIDTIVSGHCIILSELENGTDFYKLWSKKDSGLVRGESTGSWEDISKVYLVIQYTKKQ